MNKVLKKSVISAAPVLGILLVFAVGVLAKFYGEVTLFNDLFNMDSERQARSLSQLADLTGVEYVFTAHYGVVESFETAFSNWKQ